jgi:hypothetical protein
MQEQHRVAAHIHAAEALASERDLSQLDHVQALVRKLLLNELAHYRADGRFPKNRDFEAQTPYFVDAEGTRCAMAHLLEIGGEASLVSKIALERNNAWVRELANEERLIAWLNAAGLTVEEAAAIQPSYCSTNSDCVCGGNFSAPIAPASGVLEGDVVASGIVRIDHTYGDAATWKVGDTIQIRGGKAGERVLIPLGVTHTAEAELDGGVFYEVITLDPDGTFHCKSQGVPGAPPLTVEQVVQAVSAKNCKAMLTSFDSRWSRNTCSPAGCGQSPSAGAGDPTSIGILLAVVGAILVRRLL